MPIDLRLRPGRLPRGLLRSSRWPSAEGLAEVEPLAV